MTQFLDANIIIKAFTDNEDKEECRQLVHSDFVTDTLCLVEAQDAISAIKKDKTYASKCLKSLFKSNATIAELDRNLFFESLKRLEEYELNIFDMIHYTAALLNNCQEFVSYDRHFDGLEISQIRPKKI